jgi:hypothetical protein
VVSAPQYLVTLEIPWRFLTPKSWGSTLVADIGVDKQTLWLVLRQGNIDGFRALQMIQDQAQSAGNGQPFARAATPYWIICKAPFGRAVKRSSAVLRRLARAGHYQRGAPCGQPFHDPLNPSILPWRSTSLRLNFRRALNAIRLVSVFLVLCSIMACATVPPVQEMSDARQAIAAAREAGAETYASSQLDRAQDSLIVAEGYLQTGTSSAYWQARKAAISAKELAFAALLTSRDAQDTAAVKQ